MPKEPSKKAEPESPAGLSPVEETVELVRRLCVAQSQAVIYSIEHPAAQRSVDEAFEWLDQILRRKRKPIVISMTEGRVLFEGLPLEEDNPLVSRFARRLEEVHMNNIFFNPGLTRDELADFFKTLALGTSAINKAGGLIKALTEAKIIHITTKEASYVLITEDEKVVGRDARVVTGGGTSDMDSEVTRYMLAEVMKKADEKQWLINEIKNHPKKMAQRILDGIELATSRAEMGAGGAAGDSIETLLNNIRLVGQSMARASGGEEEEGVDLEEAVLSIEKELRSRSGQVMSSKVAGGFVNEILGVITSFSDQVKAKRIASEFLRGETTLKKTERLLQSLKPDEESADEFLLKMRDLLVQRGVTQDELDRMIHQVRSEPGGRGAPPAPAPEEQPIEDAGIQTFVLDDVPIPEEIPPGAPPAPPPEEVAVAAPPAEKPAAPKKKRPKKAPDQLIQEGVTRRLKELGMDEGSLAAEATEKLAGFIEAKVKEREKEFAEKEKALTEREKELERRLAAREQGLDRWAEKKKKEFQEWSTAKEAGLRQWARNEVIRLTDQYRTEARSAGDALWLRERLLEEQQAGALLWSEDGNIEYINKAARAYLKMKPGFPLTEEILGAFKRLSFPLDVLPPEYSEKNGWEPKERRLLLAIAVAIKDETGRVVGAVLKPHVNAAEAGT
ncbi:MAG: hypothetical protein JXB04_02295 [Kiritimatiellae bacterium]|nr:hypothetical protein [Kiritimatiellia bacterium]